MQVTTLQCCQDSKEVDQEAQDKSHKTPSLQEARTSTPNKANIHRCEFQKKLNNWDKELMQLMLSAKNRCNKFYNGTIEFSPLVGIYVCRLRAYRWIQLFKLGKPTNKKNFMEHVQTDAYLPRSTSLRQEEMTQKIDK
jgi:hypothetical protein